jgi:hypothetical protein
VDDLPEKSSSEHLGNECLAFMEHLTERYGDNFEVGETMLIAEVLVDHEDEEFSCVEFASSDPRRWAQVGFLTAALRAAERTLEAEDIPEQEDGEA